MPAYRYAHSNNRIINVSKATTYYCVTLLSLQQLPMTWLLATTFACLTGGHSFHWRLNVSLFNWYKKLERRKKKRLHFLYLTLESHKSITPWPTKRVFRIFFLLLSHYCCSGWNGEYDTMTWHHGCVNTEAI